MNRVDIHALPQQDLGLEVQWTGHNAANHQKRRPGFGLYHAINIAEFNLPMVINLVKFLV